MSEGLKLIITVLPEIAVFLVIGIFVRVTKRLDVLTIPGFNIQKMTDKDISLFSKKFFSRTITSTALLILVLFALEVLLYLNVLQFDTCIKILLPSIIVIIFGLVISLILLGQVIKND